MRRNTLKRAVALALALLLACSISLCVGANDEAVSTGQGEEVVKTGEEKEEESATEAEKDEEQQQEQAEEAQPQEVQPGNTRDSEMDQVSVYYSSYGSDLGWEDPSKKDGQTSGAVSTDYKLRAVKIELEGVEEEAGSIEYQAHVQNIGWQGKMPMKDGSVAGTTEGEQAMEAIKIELKGDVSLGYHVYYRMYVENYGWLDWAKDGEVAGTTGCGLSAKAIQIQIVSKTSSAPRETEVPSVTLPQVSYRAHVASVGWQKSMQAGQTAGTIGKALAVEAMEINLENTTLSGGVKYKTHVQNIGWEKTWARDGGQSGTTGRTLRVEAIQVQLTDDIATYFDIYYQVHVQNYGWMDWAKNGEMAGSTGCAYRVEAIRIRMVPKNSPSPGGTDVPGISLPQMSYQAHVANEGWQKSRKAGVTAGTTGKNRAIEAVKINLENTTLSGNIEYRMGVQNQGWEMTWIENGNVSGTTGKSLQAEAIEIVLTGDIAEYFDVYYRVHVQNLGWLGWAKNGMSAGSENYTYRMEGIQIQIRPKGSGAPGSTKKAFYSRTPEFGVDVSAYNGKVDWKKAKANGVKFAMLRCIQGSKINNLKVDTQFNANIKNAKARGVKVGVYRYGYAMTPAEAQKEAKAVVEALKKSGYRLELPVAYDVENAETQGKLTKADLTKVIQAFKGVIENHGYKFMIYANLNWLNNKINMNDFSNEEVWIARYRDHTPNLGHGYKGLGKVTIWQYTSEGKVNGINGNVDLNISYKQY